METDAEKILKWCEYNDRLIEALDEPHLLLHTRVNKSNTIIRRLVRTMNHFGTKEFKGIACYDAQLMDAREALADCAALIAPGEGEK